MGFRGLQVFWHTPFSCATENKAVKAISYIDNLHVSKSSARSHSCKWTSKKQSVITSVSSVYWIGINLIITILRIWNYLFFFLCSNISACTYFRKLSVSSNLSTCMLLHGDKVSFLWSLIIGIAYWQQLCLICGYFESGHSLHQRGASAWTVFFYCFFHTQKSWYVTDTGITEKPSPHWAGQGIKKSALNVMKLEQL